MDIGKKIISKSTRDYPSTNIREPYNYVLRFINRLDGENKPIFLTVSLIILMHIIFKKVYFSVRTTFYPIMVEKHKWELNYLDMTRHTNF